MWISRERFNYLKNRIEVLENDRKTITESVNLILGHLKMKLWKEPSKEAQTVLLTEKEYAKKFYDPIYQNQKFLNYVCGVDKYESRNG